jgi:hypothetical protein
MDSYVVEDIILEELRRMAGFQRVDDVDVGLIHFSGIIDLGRLAERLCERRDEWLKILTT